MSDTGAGPKYQIVSVDFGQDGLISVVYVDPDRSTREVTEVTNLQVDPRIAEPEALEMLDAMEAFIDAIALARRSPPDAIRSRTARRP